jgi:hypothetical protein
MGPLLNGPPDSYRDRGGFCRKILFLSNRDIDWFVDVEGSPRKKVA